MKTLSVAVAVAIVLTFICIQHSSAVPTATQQVQEVEEPMSVEFPLAEQEETPVDSWKMPYNIREKRGIKCKFCCGCCTPGVCGLCCRF
ncbi:hepcidin-like isoform X1 [Pungitius pungitius]|uniref:hepcidin-like isoform X1 n=1 Tax=Pungitius pungitius TaxID=134920 RepID=UPI0018870074|nr:hepcidin-like isoform X1 [Pungitius pungitius]